MEQEELLNKEYFDWLCSYVGGRSRRKLLQFLYRTPFVYTVPLDGNRYEEGVNLRYQFGDEKHIHYRYVTGWLDNRDCSVLEMMVALSLRIETHITGDPDYGDRTSFWFNEMLKSMHLDTMVDSFFNEEEAEERVSCMLQRRYLRNGDGGLFTLKRTRKDLRHVEIWYQAMWFIDEVMNIK
jgi:hypothetical protein